MTEMALREPERRSARTNLEARRKFDASLINADAPPVSSAPGLLSARGLMAKFTSTAHQQLVVRVDPQTAIGDHVKHLGGKITRDRGPVRTVTLPAGAIAEFAAIEPVERIRLPHRLSPRLDEVASMHDMSAYRAAAGNDKRRGDGVLIGIVDSGVSGTHDAFKGRLVECWDQTAKGKGAGEFGYGALFTNPQQFIDPVGHGTHVAGIAAGADLQFTGVAPKARILVVRTDFSETHVQDAITYIFDRAKELGLPAVVNLSLGGHGDPHDGTDELDRHVEYASGPGRIIVAAAGNEGDDNIHTRVELEEGAEAIIGFRVPHLTDRIRLNIWYSGGEAEIAVATPNGVATPLHGPGGTKPHVHTLGVSGRVVMSTPERDLTNNDHQVDLRIDSGTSIQPGRWFLRVKATTAAIDLHAWSINESTVGSEATFSHPVNSHLIGSPGAAPSAITVAAYTSKNRWTTVAGSEGTTGYELKAVAPFSSPGPLRGRDVKPDVAAAGSTIVSCRSAAAQYDGVELVDEQHVAMGGTSMACAVVSGVVATLLEENPTWTTAEAMEALKPWTRGTYSPADGFGLVLLR